MGSLSQVSSSGDGGIGDMSPQDWQNFLNKTRLADSRNKQITDLNNSYGSGSNSDSSSSNSSNFNNNSSIFGGSSNGLADYTSQAKDLASFNLKNAEDQSSYDAGLRNTEYNQDNARQMQLNDQTYGWQQKLNNDTQNALSSRLNSQLQNNLQLQNDQFTQQNNTIGRAVSLASTRLGGN